MSKGKRPTAAIAEELGRPVANELGLTLWDVRFEKEGSSWFLRYFIDKPGGVNIDDCEAFSRRVEKLLDEADPIDQSYCLEVSSPGVERELTRPEHFATYMGSTVQVRLIRPLEGKRDFTGKLTGYENDCLTLLLEDGQSLPLQKSDTAFIRLFDDYDYGGTR